MLEPAAAASAQLLRLDDDDLLLSPSADRPIPTPLTANNNMSDPLASVLQCPLPTAAHLPQVLTPPAANSSSTSDFPSMDTLVGACIAPVAPSALPPPPPALSVKSGVKLRLPSFEVLGIANPHSSSSIDILTPPEDKVHQMWMPPLSLPHLPVSGPVEASRNVQQNRPSFAAGSITPVSITSEGTSAPRDHLQRSISDGPRSFWNQIQGPSDDLITNLLDSHDPGVSINIMSHALPCPSPSGFIFPHIINSLQQRTADNSLRWINVFHALPGKFGLNDVPTSPPATPDPPVGGRDYFTAMTFDSAVRVLDYQDNLVSMPRSPHPLVPPSSISLSIIERYIPPTNANEFSGMFSLGGRSLLIDRLVELSANSGSLLLIYPTKTGAETFTRQYLGPVLDPLLRSMRTIHHLPVDMAASMGKMAAVDRMLEFDELHARLRTLCDDLAGNDERMSRYAKVPSRFVVERADRHTVVPDRSVWAGSWWAKQEKARIRETVNRYSRVAFQAAAGSHITPTTIVENVLDGVAARSYPPGNSPTDGIEVGVFVIRRFAADK